MCYTTSVIMIRGLCYLSTNVRVIALNILLKIFSFDAFSNILLNQELKNSDLPNNDKAFFVRLVYGVVEKKLTLDHIIAKFSKTKLKKISPDILMILRIGTYQIFFMDGVKDFAAVNETVNLVKAVHKYKTRAFVNGILRNMIRQKDTVTLDTDEAKYSCPAELINFFKRSYGDTNTEKFLNTLDAPSHVDIRVNTLLTTVTELKNKLQSSYDIEVYDHPFLKNALRLKKIHSLETMKEFQEGLFHVQGISSQFACSVLDPQENEIVFDMCSAPGGKAFTIAQMMKDTGEVFAFDIYEHKIGLIKSGADRLHIHSIEASVHDGTKALDHPILADRILCDVPCSGLGVIKKKPEIRYRDIGVLKEFPELQYQILTQAAKHLKQNGIIVYSTCTLNPEENGKIIAKFLSAHKDFKGIEVKRGDIQHAIDEPENQLTIIPGVNTNDTDGFFIAKLQKLGEK